MKSEKIYCPWRRREVSLTPEEWVRQQTLQRLVEAGYPKSRIAVEQAIKVGEVQKRCDAVIYDSELKAVCIVEFKAETVSLTQKVLDQAAVYNRKLGVRYLMISNGKDTYICQVGAGEIRFLAQLPTYEELCKRE